MLYYRQWPTLGGIVHTHSTYATAWAQSQIDIPLFGTTHADHLTVDVPCAPPMDDAMIAGDYEYQNLNPVQVEMVLVANHAPFTWGKDVKKAVYNSAVLEELAKMAYLTRRIRPDAPLMKDALIEKHFLRKHGKNAYYGQ